MIYPTPLFVSHCIIYSNPNHQAANDLGMYQQDNLGSETQAGGYDSPQSWNLWKNTSSRHAFSDNGIVFHFVKQWLTRHFY
jgi:hypothetical protein